MTFPLSYPLRLLLLFTLGFYHLKGNSQNYNFDHFSIEEGLSQSTVSAIFQDSRGYLWIGTEGGICKFDGSNFIQYTESSGISGNLITDITEDFDGNIWFTSKWGGITKYNGNKFTIYSEKDEPNVNNNNVCIFTDDKGKIWIGGKKGLSIFSNQSFTSYTPQENKYLGASINFINQDSKNNIWIGSSYGLTIINEKDTFHISKKNGLLTDNVISVFEDHQGDYWFGTKGNGIFKLLNPTTLEKEHYQFKQVVDDGLKITKIIEDSDKKIWFTTSLNGLFYIDKNNSIININNKNGLKTNHLTTIFKDQSHNLWLGTNAEGLVKVGNLAFTYFDNIPGLNQSTYSIIEDDKGHIWTSCADGLYQYNGEKSTHYTIGNGLRSNFILSSVKDKDGVLWFGTGGGLCRYKNGVFKNFTIQDGLPSNMINKLLLGKDGNLWIGTDGSGLVKYDHSTFTTFTSKETNLSNNFIHSLFEDSKGNIWIGTDNGINKYANGAFHDYSSSDGICNPFVGDIAEDKYGNIWFATRRCVVKYDGVDFKSITVNDGLSSNIIYLVHWSSKGSLWVGTNKGVDKISFNSYGHINEIKNYGLVEGFKGIECNQGTISEDKDGNLWIGTVKGCIMYDPKKDKSDPQVPFVYIDNLKLSFENVNWSKYSKNLYDWNGLPENLVLQHNENHITFEFSAINLTYPKYIRYSFKLEGFDKGWYQRSTKKSATYSNLPPGDYTFMVKASNGNGNWSTMPATFSFSINTPIWKTWWFYILFCIFLIYLIYKITSYREKQQIIISQDLEKMVKDRTYLIEKQRDEKEVLLKEIHHRVKNNMQVISSLLNIQSSYTADKNALKLFDEARRRIRAMALIHEKLYQSSDLVSISFKEYITILVDDIISSYVINCDIKVDIKIDPIKLSIDTLIPLGLILNELISNTLKYAFIDKEKGEIKIHLKFDEANNSYQLVIGDNGIGMEEDINTTEKESLGIELIKVFVEQLDGRIKRLKDPGTVYQIDFKNQK